MTESMVDFRRGDGETTPQLGLLEGLQIKSANYTEIAAATFQSLEKVWIGHYVDVQNLTGGDNDL